MNKSEKREPRSYKMAETPYQKALRRGVKEKKPLATMLEKVAELYGKGANITFFPVQNEIKVVAKEKISAKIKQYKK